MDFDRGPRILITIRHGTTELNEGGSGFTSTYKQIGRTQYILGEGDGDPPIDISRRWPGAFALGEFVSDLMSISDPAAIATPRFSCAT